MKLLIVNIRVITEFSLEKKIGNRMPAVALSNHTTPTPAHRTCVMTAVWKHLMCLSDKGTLHVT